MNITWTFIISLLAGLLAGVYSGLFVMRKTEYNNKRQSSRQMLKPLRDMLTWTLISIQNYMRKYNCSSERVVYDNSKPFPLEASKNMLTIFQEWWNNVESLDRLKQDNILDVIKSTDDLLNDFLKGHWGFDQFFSLYPMQSYYFEELYRIQAAKNAMMQIGETLKLEVEVEPDIHKAYFYAYHQGSNLVEISVELCNVYEMIVRYTTSKSWTWRIFVPPIRY